MSRLSHSSESGIIAVVLKGYPRLSETFIAQELRGLERRGFRLHFFSLRHPTDTKTHPIHQEIQAPVTYLPEYLHHEPIRVAKSVATVFLRKGFWRAAGRWLKDLLKDRSRNRVRRFGQGCVLAAELPKDVTRLYAHFIHTPAAVTGYASLIAGRPWTCSAHAKDIWTSPDWELRRNLAETDWVATCTSTGAQHLASLSDDATKVHLIYHGLDLSRFPSPPQQLDANRNGSQANQPLRLLSVGRAVEKKGFDLLLAALAKLPPDLHWRWAHIGGGAKLSELQAQADALRINGRINWLGAQSQQDVLEAYRNSDLFVLPCRIAADGDRDGLPNVLVEAQSQRLACISTPISGIPELIVNGATGCLVSPENPTELANAIVSLGRNIEERKRLAEAGEARVQSAFDMHAGLAQLAALFPDADAPASSAAAEAAE